MECRWIVGLSALLVVALPAAAATLGERCEATKLKEAGKYDLCRLKEEAKAIQRGTIPDFGRCDAILASRWVNAENRGGGECRTTGDQAAMATLLANHADDVATALAGAGLPTCSADLATCGTALSGCESLLGSCQGRPIGQRIVTGSTTCTDNAGLPLPCAGTGQDGELQEGLSRSYVDNGDGTITDTRTGLVWEKLSRDATIHSIDPLFGQEFGSAFNWTDAVAAKIATLNAEAFAGHSDWRVPNVNELQSIIDYGRIAPAVDPIFNTNCSAMCTVLTCSCTHAGWGAWYWASTSYADPEFPYAAWFVDFDSGHLMVDQKTSANLVRAVRSGL